MQTAAAAAAAPAPAAATATATATATAAAAAAAAKPSPLKTAWDSLKRKHAEELLPSLIFEDKLPSFVFIGKEVFKVKDGEIAKKYAEEIDHRLHAATRGRSFSDLCVKELNDVDWSLLAAVHAQSPEVSSVCEYLLKAPGKRFRPLLLLLVNRLLQHCTEGKGETRQKKDAASLPLIMVQVAELIHTASLMHDDVLDEAETRRGRAAAHSVFGNKKAVLGGDFVLARASSIAAVAGYPEVCLRVAQAVESLVKGELLQCFSSRSDIGEAFEAMLAKTYHKTASLMAESCACIAFLGGNSREIINWSHELGAAIGLAFQLYDDELDLLRSSKELGKPANSDLKNGVITAPLLLAASEHPAALLPLLQRGLGAPGDAQLAISRIYSGSALPRARLLSRLYIQHALNLLQRLPQGAIEQQNAAADLASLLLWAMKRTSN